MVAAIIDALGANQTKTGREALKKLLLGEIKTAVADAAVTSLAAQAMMKKPTPEEQELLMAAALNPARLRSGGAADPALPGN